MLNFVRHSIYKILFGKEGEMMCGVTEKLADIVRKQAVLIEQERIAGAVFPADLSEERKQAEDDLDRIEMKLRRI